MRVIFFFLFRTQCAPSIWGLVFSHLCKIHTHYLLTRSSTPSTLSSFWNSFLNMLTQSFHPQCLPRSFFDKKNSLYSKEISSALALSLFSCVSSTLQPVHWIFIAMTIFFVCLEFNYFFLTIPSCLLLSILCCTCFKTSNLPFISLDILNIPWLRFLSDFSALSSPWGVNPSFV